MEDKNYDSIATHEDLLAALREIHSQSAELFASLPENVFFHHPGEDVWSPAENVVHLVKSVKAVAQAMELPKLALAPFGRSKSGSRTYAGMRDYYQSKLAAGGRAGGRYVPDRLEPSDPDDAARSRRRALEGWDKAGRSLVRALEKWSEKNLDRYRLPHPLLGKLTVREMLFFTHYHDLHHMRVVQRQADAHQEA